MCANVGCVRCVLCMILMHPSVNSAMALVDVLWERVTREDGN
jgi:hypothetical protein